MRFRSKVWHPNVSSANGAICLDILKDNWSPALTLKTALLSLQALLASPEPGDPQVRVKPCTFCNYLDLDSIPRMSACRPLLASTLQWAHVCKLWS